MTPPWADPTGPITWTPTQLATWARCPQQAYQRYARGVAGPPTPASALGTAAHALIAAAAAAIQAGRWPRPTAEGPAPLLAALDHAADAALTRWPMLAPEAASHLVGWVHRALQLLPWDRPLALEVPRTVALTGQDTLAGRCDAVVDLGDALWVIDWKTGFGLPAAEPLAAYAVLVADGRPVQVTARPLRSAHAVITQTWDPTALPALADHLRDTLTDIRQRLIQLHAGADPAHGAPPQPGRACTGCPAAAWCPAWAPAPSGLAPTLDPDAPPDQAQAAGRALLAAQAAVEQARRALKTWVQRHGPVPAGDRVWQLRPTQQYTVPDRAALHALLAAAQAAGADPTLIAAVETVRTDVLRRLARQLHRRDPLLAEALQACVVATAGPPRFVAAAPPAAEEASADDDADG